MFTLLYHFHKRWNIKRKRVNVDNVSLFYLDLYNKYTFSHNLYWLDFYYKVQRLKTIKTICLFDLYYTSMKKKKISHYIVTSIKWYVWWVVKWAIKSYFETMNTCWLKPSLKCDETSDCFPLPRRFYISLLRFLWKHVKWNEKSYQITVKGVVITIWQKQFSSHHTYWRAKERLSVHFERSCFIRRFHQFFLLFFVVWWHDHCCLFVHEKDKHKWRKLYGRTI